MNMYGKLLNYFYKLDKSLQKVTKKYLALYSKYKRQGYSDLEIQKILNKNRRYKKIQDQYKLGWIKLNQKVKNILGE